MTSSLRSRVVEAGARAIEQAPGSYTVEMDTEAAAQAALDAMLDYLTEEAIPLYGAGGIARAFYIDDEPDEDTIWVIDLAVLRNPAEETDTP